MNSIRSDSLFLDTFYILLLPSIISLVDYKWKMVRCGFPVATMMAIWALKVRKLYRLTEQENQNDHDTNQSSCRIKSPSNEDNTNVWPFV